MDGLGNARIVLVTGKGGVGKTTVAAAYARSLASRGRRVLCAEVAADDEQASPLAAALGIKGSGDEPVEVARNLKLIFLKPSAGHLSFLRDVLPMRVLADAAMRTAAVRRFLAAAPTFAEMGVLYRILELSRKKTREGFEHETIIVDLPATGHALAIAQIPASILRVLSTGPIAAAVREGLSLLEDPERTRAIVVALPESLPVSEALELERGLAEHRISVGALVLNRVPADPFEAGERERIVQVVGEQRNVLGLRSLDRIDRARAAKARLAGAAKAQVLMLPAVHESSEAAVASSLMKGFDEALKAHSDRGGT